MRADLWVSPFFLVLHLSHLSRSLLPPSECRVMFPNSRASRTRSHTRTPVPALPSPVATHARGQFHTGAIQSDRETIQPAKPTPHRADENEREQRPTVPAHGIDLPGSDTTQRSDPVCRLTTRPSALTLETAQSNLSPAVPPFDRAVLLSARRACLVLFSLTAVSSGLACR